MYTIRALTRDGFRFDMLIPEAVTITNLQLFVPEGIIVDVPFYHHGERIHSQCNLAIEEEMPAGLSLRTTDWVPVAGLRNDRAFDEPEGTTAADE
jgi:hypothetical protein